MGYSLSGWVLVMQMDDSTVADLAIIIVNWNTADFLEGCLQSLPWTDQTFKIDVFVIDNDSQDNSIELVQTRYSHVKLLQNKENVGFARANNQALEIANARHMLLLNPDTVVADLALQKMVAFMDAHPDCGVLGPRLVFGDGRSQVSAGHTPAVGTLFSYAFYLDKVLPRQFPSIWLKPSAAEIEPYQVDWVSGACLMVRSEVVQDVGGLDPSYFMYAEDVEYCDRIRAAGWQVFCLPVVRITHFNGRSMAQRESTFRRQHVRGLNHFYRQKYSPLTTRLLNLLGSIGFASRSFAFSLVGKLRGDKNYSETASVMLACAAESIALVVKPGGSEG